MDVAMYAFDPVGHAHEIPGMDIPTMNSILALAKDRDDAINVHDVTDRDGSPRRVITIMWRGLVFNAFDFPFKRP